MFNNKKHTDRHTQLRTQQMIKNAAGRILKIKPKISPHVTATASTATASTATASTATASTATASTATASTVEKEVKQLISRLLSKGQKQVFPSTIVQKIINNNGKCGTKSILSTQRTTCSGRCLIPYEVVMNNNCNDENKLRTFYEGLTINLINEDYFNVKEKNDDFSKYAIEEIGGEKIVSSMVSAMSVNGDSGSAHALKCFNLLESEIKKYSWIPLKRKPEYVSDDGKRYESLVTSGNDKIHGHYYVDVSGGNNKNKKNKEIKREHQCFIAYYDYANKEVALHINVKMIYELLHCFDIEDCLTPSEIDEIKKVFETFLKGIHYDDGCLYDSHVMQKCLKYKNGKKILVCPLTDNKISIHHFKINDDECLESIQVCHQEAVSKEKIYFDETRGYMVTARRPQNLFWGTKRGNMQQQELTIDELWAEKKKQCDEHEWE